MSEARGLRLVLWSLEEPLTNEFVAQVAESLSNLHPTADLAQIGTG